MNNFDVYNLLTSEERELVNNTIAEAVSRAGYDIDSFDYELTGSVL